VLRHRARRACRGARCTCAAPPYALISFSTASIASSAIFASSSGVRFWIGCGTQCSAGSKPSVRACAAAAG